MKKLTSLADFYFRLKSDERYKLVAISAYEGSSDYRYHKITLPPTFENAMMWIDKWTQDYIKNNNGKMCSPNDGNTCKTMVSYLNDRMRDTGQFFDCDE